MEIEAAQREVARQKATISELEKSEIQSLVKSISR
jgi:hypothetical protein